MIIRLKREPDGGYSYADGRYRVHRHAHGRAWGITDTAGQSLRDRGITHARRATSRRSLGDVRTAIREALEREDAARTRAPAVVDATVTGGRL